MFDDADATGAGRGIAQPQSVPIPTPIQSPNVHRLAFHGTGAAFFALVLKNVLLTLLTLGIYMPWAKTARRQYLWQNTEVAGHRLRYHGTGRELFLGYLKVALAYAIFVGLPLLLSKTVSQTAATIAQVALALMILPLIPFAIWGARRYLLSRTSWRGIRLRLDGPASVYAKAFFGGYFLTLVTLGLYGPIWMNRLHRIATNATAVGTERFEYRGEDRAVWKMAMAGLVLSILTLGIYYFWYRAKLVRYQLEHTRFSGAHGELSMTGGHMLQLTLLQIIGLTMTAGLAFPWITTYSLQFTLARLRFVGPIDFAHIYQAASDGNAAADGLADALDVGGAL